MPSGRLNQAYLVYGLFLERLAVVDPREKLIQGKRKQKDLKPGRLILRTLGFVRHLDAVQTQTERVSVGSTLTCLCLLMSLSSYLVRIRLCR